MGASPSWRNQPAQVLDHKCHLCLLILLLLILVNILLLVYRCWFHSLQATLCEATLWSTLLAPCCSCRPTDRLPVVRIRCTWVDLLLALAPIHWTSACCTQQSKYRSPAWKRTMMRINVLDIECTLNLLLKLSEWTILRRRYLGTDYVEGCYRPNRNTNFVQEKYLFSYFLYELLLAMCSS